MKRKNKLFFILFVFILFIFINNKCYAYDLPDNPTNINDKYGYQLYNHFYEVDSLPTIEDLNTINKIADFKPYDFYLFKTGDVFLFFQLFYLNKSTNQALFTCYNLNENGLIHYNNYYNVNHVINNKFYFINNNNFYILAEGYAQTNGNQSVVAHFNDGLITSFDFYTNTTSFYIEPNKDACRIQMGINVYNFGLGSSDSYFCNITFDNEGNQVFSNTKSYRQYQVIGEIEYTYSDTNLLFAITPRIVNDLNYVAFYDKNLITQEKLFQLNYYYCNYLSTPYSLYNDYNNSYNFSIETLYKRNKDLFVQPEILLENVNLYIDDFNLKKRFKFDLKIPFRDSNTKYYLFLNSYDRIDYDNVTIDLKVITIDLPEGFDSSSYFNYMYYDNILKKCLAPAGAIIKEYSCVVDSGSVGTCELLEERTGIRNTFEYNGVSMTDLILKGFLQSGTNEIYNIDTLFNTNTRTLNNYLSNVFQYVLDSYFLVTGEHFILSSFLDLYDFSNVEDFIYKYALEVFYYDNTPIAYFDDFIGGNYHILSYENSRNSWNNQAFYNLFRKTFVYSQENYIDSISLAFSYIDNEDVSNLLPEEEDKTYLTSPYYKENPQSSSGGYIVYNITNVFDGNDTIINYGKEDSPIRDNMNDNYYNEFDSSNNLNLNDSLNNNITIVELSSTDKGLLGGIYTTLIEIKEEIKEFADNSINNVQNITNNTNNFFTVLFIPDFSKLSESFEEIAETGEEHLGFLWQPFVFINFFFESIEDLNDEEIILHIPEIKIMDFTVIPETQFDFNNQLFNVNDNFRYIRKFQLMICNFTLICFFINYIIRTYKGVFENDNQ